MAASTSIFLKHVILCTLLVILAKTTSMSHAEDDYDPVEDSYTENEDAETEEEDSDKTEIQNASMTAQTQPKDFYSFSVYDLHGDLVSLEKYRGKVVLVVNVASECGFTDGHYKALIRMKNVLAYTNKFEILAFPCNQFGAQEPGTNAEIQEWVHENYHPNFPIFSKINVLDEDVPEAWQFLIDKSGKSPNWNFWKYLVTDQGHVVDAWGPRVSVEELFRLVRKHVEMTSPATEAAQHTQDLPQKDFEHVEL